MKLEKIDFLRGFAIIAVFFFHTIIIIYPNINHVVYHDLLVDVNHYTKSQLINLFNPITYGHSGVQLFLIISGFLIHYNYLKRGKALQYGIFINRRFWRIYPPYLIALIVFGCWFFTGSQDLLAHALLIHNFSVNHIYQVNPSFWSLALEFQLYLIYPLYLFLNKKIGVKSTVYIAWIMAVVFIGFGIAYHITDQAYNKFLFKNWVTWIMGAYVAECFINKKRLYKGNWLGLGFILLLVMASKAISWYEDLNVYLFTVVYVLMLDKLLNSSIKLPAFTKVIISATSFVGMVSYSLYLVHQPFLPQLLNNFKLGIGGQKGMFISSIIVFLIITGASYLLYILIEKPSIAIGKKIESGFRRTSKT